MLRLDRVFARFTSSLTRGVGTVAAAALLCGLITGFASAANWPGFRGLGDSHAAVTDLPLTWSDTENTAWTVEIPGYGQSSPVVWNDRAFVTAVKGDNKEFLVIACVSVESGKVLWQKEVPSTLGVKQSNYVSRAAPTPVVDDNRVYAFFESGEFLAFTHAGEQVWSRSLAKEYGEIKGNHGLGGSPAQTETSLIVLVDHSGPSYLVALDKLTGATLWKKDRDERVSWSSPVVTDGPRGPEVVISSNGVVQCFLAKDGEPIWEVTGLKGTTVASATVTPEAVLVGSSEPKNSMLIRRGGQGNVGETHVSWKADSATSSFGSPVIQEGRAYFVSKAKIASAVSLADGKTLWTERLPDSTWASAVAAGDRIYFFCTNGETVVVRTGDAYEKLAQNKLTVADRVYGVAVVPQGFLIRTGTKLTLVLGIGDRG